MRGWKSTAVMALVVATPLAGGPARSRGVAPRHVRTMQAQLAAAPLPARSLPWGVAAQSATIGTLVDPVVRAAMAAANAPGAAVAVVLDGAIVYERGYGVRHRRQGGAVSPSTVFRTGSIEKSMTAAAVLQQVEAGRVWLADPASVYTGELTMRGPWPAGGITVHHLLAHNSGIPDGLEVPEGPTGEAALSLWPARLAEARLYAPPGLLYNYSNPGYGLAGLIAERAAGVPFRTLMATRVFAPAGMSSTTHDPAAAMSGGNFAWGHADDLEPGREVIVAPDAFESWSMDPAGTAFTTAGDLARWAITLMNDGGGVLRPASAALLQAPLVPDLNYDTSFYGYGVATMGFGDLVLKMHDGSFVGWGSFLVWHPPTRSAVAIVSNSRTPLTVAALQALLLTAPLPEPTPPACTSDLASWRRFAGRYDLYTAVGAWLHPAAPERLIGDVSWSPVGLTLTLSLPDGGPPILETPLVFVCGTTFGLDLDGDAVPDQEITFTVTASPPPRRVWLRQRFLTGERLPAAFEIVR